MKFIIFVCISFSCYFLARLDILKIKFSPPKTIASENKSNEVKIEEKTNKFDPLAMHSDVEIKLLESLAERRKNLETQEQEFQKKLLTLKIFEVEIKKKLDQLKLVKESIQRDLNLIDKKDAERLENFSNICKKMNPKSAAKIFEQLEANEAIMIINCMSPKNVSDIIDKMNPEKAKIIVKQMVSKTSNFSKA